MNNIFKNSINAIIVGVAIIISVIIVSSSYFHYRNMNAGGITITGSSTQNFVSDLIVWRGYFSRTATTSQEAYAQLKTDADEIKNYLVGKGVNANEIVFSSVNVSEKTDREEIYDTERMEYRYVDNFVGYVLSQNISIESNEVDKIETISRDITQLIDAGIDFYSSSPEYYYTKLNELKLNMITDATENAKSRADIIVKNSKGKLGDLAEASLGVFQITAQNSSEEAYDYMGVFNTTSKNKTALVTVRLRYYLK